MWSDVEDENGAFRVRRHTVTVPPGHSRSYRVRADALGRWAYHCHMTQLTLGLDRDSAIVAGLFDERDPAVKKMLAMAIQAARARGKYIGICGQGPSDHPDLAQWLMEQGIESVSLNPDTVVDTWLALAKAKRA